MSSRTARAPELHTELAVSLVLDELAEAFVQSVDRMAYMRMTAAERTALRKAARDHLAMDDGTSVLRRLMVERWQRPEPALKRRPRSA